MCFLNENYIRPGLPEILKQSSSLCLNSETICVQGEECESIECEVGGIAVILAILWCVFHDMWTSNLVRA